MSDQPTQPPDRLSIDPRSKHFDADVLERGIGIKFKDKERTNVVEYCISEGWVRLPAGRSNDRFGNPMTLKVNGPVEVWFEDAADAADAENAQNQASEDSAEGSEADASSEEE